MAAAVGQGGWHTQQAGQARDSLVCVVESRGEAEEDRAAVMATV